MNYLEVVLKEEPYTFYRLSKTLKLEDDEGISESLAECIYEVYLKENKEIPDSLNLILEDIAKYISDQEHELEEIESLLTLARYKAYIEEHGLGWVVDILYENTIDKSKHDPLLDYEFIIKHHTVGIDFSSDEVHIMGMFHSWLEVLKDYYQL